MKNRIISAIVMLIVAVPIIWYGGRIFRFGVSVVGLFALKEILDLKKSHKDIPLLVKFFSMIALLLIILAEYDGYSLAYGVTYRGIGILLFGILGISLFYDDKFRITDALFLIGAILLIGVAFNAIILVRMFSLEKFVFLILIFILNDTGAFVGGKLLGKHRLIPSVSPNKTVEGSVIGLIIGTGGTALFYHYLINPLTIKVIIGIVLLSVMGQMGDLVFSKLKRENNIKDFSNLIPGHGGILDRLDSTIVIMLGYLIFYNLF